MTDLSSLSAEINFKQNLASVKSIVDYADNLINTSVVAGNGFPLIANAFLDSAVVLLSTNFESFLKDLGSEFAKKLTAMRIKVDHCPNDILISHFEHTPTWISQHKPRFKYDVDKQTFIDIARKWSTASDANGIIELIEETYGDCMANPTYPTVVEVFDRMGIDIKDSVKQMNVLDIKTQAINIVSLKTWLEGFGPVRNSIVHGDLNHTPIPVVDVKNYLNVLEEVGSILSDLTEKQINNVQTEVNTKRGLTISTTSHP